MDERYTRTLKPVPVEVSMYTGHAESLDVFRTHGDATFDIRDDGTLELVTNDLGIAMEVQVAEVIVWFGHGSYTKMTKDQGGRFFHSVEIDGVRP